MNDVFHIDIQKKKVVSIFVSLHSIGEVLWSVKDAIQQKKNLTIGYANPHSVLAAKQSHAFSSALNSIDIIHIDGVGVQAAVRFLYPSLAPVGKVPGSDLYISLLDMADENGWSIFLFGTDDNTLKKAATKIAIMYQNIRLVGTRNGFDHLDDPSIVEEINKARPDILFIGLGIPKQEYWIELYKKDLLVPVSITVGGGIDLMAKKRSRAPVLFRTMGMEWLFRLMQEPGRLWKRYLIGVPIFIYLVFRQKIGKDA